MLVKGSVNIHNTRDRFVTIEWAWDEQKQTVLRCKSPEGRTGKWVRVEDILSQFDVFAGSA